MKRILIATATGAVIGTVVYQAIPCKKNKFNRKIAKKGKKMTCSIIKKVSKVISNIM